MDLKEIQALIKFVAKSGAQEVSLETEDFKINIKTGPDASDQPTYVQAVAPQQMPAAAPAVTPVERLRQPYQRKSMTAPTTLRSNRQ